jgi:hypothetical protein
MVIFAFSSCFNPTYYGKIINSCKTENELRYTLGPPDEEFSNGKFGKIMIYNENYTQQRPGVIYQNGPMTTYSAPQQVNFNKYMKFYIDNFGNIYQCETNHKTKEPTGAYYLGVFAGTFFGTIALLFLFDSLI